MLSLRFKAILRTYSCSLFTASVFTDSASIFICGGTGEGDTEGSVRKLAK